MITIEFDLDETAITILDDTGELEDIQAFLYDDYCHIRQWNEKTQMFDVVTMKPEMYYKLMKAFNLPEGTYVLEKNVTKVT
jgi:hypothetical protein